MSTEKEGASAQGQGASKEMLSPTCPLPLNTCPFFCAFADESSVSTHALTPVAPIRKRLWKLGFALALLLVTLTIGNAMIPKEKAVSGKMLGHDFLAFYTGGHFARTEQLAKLYDLDAVRNFQASMVKSAGLEVEKGYGPFWNPPFVALAFEPLAALDYPDALKVWMILNGAVMVLTVGVLVKLLGAGDWKTWALVPLFFMANMPFIQAVSHGQNTFITLGLLLAVVILWRNEMPLAAGLIAGLLAYKPQHAAIVALVLCCSLGRQAILGLGVTGVILLVINITALPGTLQDFLFKMPANLTAFQEAQPYYWERHATFKAFWRLMLMGKSLGSTTPLVMLLWCCSMAPFAIGLVLAAWREAGRKWVGGFQELIKTERTRDRLIAATIAAAPLLMPFSFDYDLLLLAIPAVLWARELIKDRKPLSGVDRVAMFGWVGLYLWTFVNPALAGRIGVNGTVVFLAIVASAMICRSLKRDAVAEVQETPVEPTIHVLRKAA
jgi:hypothetical protein